LQSKFGVALQPTVGFALQLEVITFQQEILAPQGEVDDDG
jgi:hypothetical protein